MFNKINKELLAENLVGFLSAVLLILIIAFFIFKKEHKNSILQTKNTEITQPTSTDIQQSVTLANNETPLEAPQKKRQKKIKKINDITVGFVYEEDLRKYEAAKRHHKNMAYQKILDKERQAKEEQEKAKKEIQQLIQERQRLDKEKQQIEKKKQQAQLDAKAEQERLEKERQKVQQDAKAEQKRLEKKRQQVQRDAKAERERLEKKRQQVQRDAKAERERLEKEKQQAQQRIAEERKAFEAEKKRQAEAARKKAEAEKKRQAEIARKKAEAEKKAETERKRIAAELAASIAKMEAEEAETNARQQAISQTSNAIKNKINRKWIAPANLPSGLRVKLGIKLASSGKVIGTPRIIQSSGYRVFDNSAIEAVKRASPLPLPGKKAWAKLFTKEELILNFPE